MQQEKEHSNHLRTEEDIKENQKEREKKKLRGFIERVRGAELNDHCFGAFANQLLCFCEANLQIVQLKS